MPSQPNQDNPRDTVSLIYDDRRLLETVCEKLWVVDDGGAVAFDGGYKDFATYAFPILQKHNVPFMLYLPTAFPDGLGEAWWLALEEMIAHGCIIASEEDKTETYMGVPINAGDLGTKGGLRCDERSRVLDGKGIVPEGHPLCVGVFGEIGRAHV